jgi:DNA-binding transcriptional LysR family regulator
MFELSQIRCFVMVAEELHFGRAATRLHMTQPPLSRQVQLLEHQLGAPLLERNSRNVCLTSAGRCFLPEARQILRLTERATLAVRRAARGESGTVSIGYTAASGYSLMPAMIARCRQMLPDVELTLREMVTREQTEALALGQLDLALLRPGAPLEGFEARRVVREALVAALPAQHPLAHGRPLTLADFEGAPFVMYSPIEARYFHDLVTGMLSLAGVNPDYTQYTVQIHSILALVAAGLGVSLVPAAAQSLRFKGVVFRPVTKVRASRLVELYIAWKRENDNPVRQRVLNACLDYCYAAYPDVLETEDGQAAEAATDSSSIVIV